MNDHPIRFLTDAELSAWIGAGFVMGMAFQWLLSRLEVFGRKRGGRRG